MKLFDFVKVLFSTSDKYDKLTKYQRGKNRFMIQRFMAIQYPETSNLLNWNGSNPTYINDSFRLIAKQYTRPPKWIYTKVKNVKENKSDFKPKDSTLKFYLNKNECSMRDYNEVLKSPRKDAMLAEIKELEKLLDKHGYDKQ